MDTALMTFMLQTSSSTQTVHLIGSWDNFQKHYPMERDVKRSRGQWRGCFAFEDIICDGDGRSSKRTGGLKMGSTYFYYYELDHGTEHYDSTLPFTALCPYLPGQPVNLLSVPIEVQPLRYRSASMNSAVNVDVKTMNPADKFMSPRQAPPLPTLTRLNTSPPVLSRKRSARSLSPKVDRQWSPRTFFGLRSPLKDTLDSNNRGRAPSLSKINEKDLNASTSTLASRPEEPRMTRSQSPSRSPSPPTLQRLHSRDPSPLRQIVENSGYNNTILTIPDIAEEIEDDDENFASEHQFHRGSVHEKGLHTQLSPPPSSRPQLPVRSMTDTSKPLPNLPNASETRSLNSLPLIADEDTKNPFLMPPPLRLRPAPVLLDTNPRSHFSVSTISTSISPTDSSFCFSEIADDEEISTYGDDLSYSPILSEGKGFAGYSLPEGEYDSEHTLRKQTPLSPLGAAASRTTFGANAFAPVVDTVVDSESMSALEQLMSEMGYLGDVITGK